jgi:methionyl-tRNA formyltransferase
MFSLRVALMFQEGGLVAREYYWALKARDRSPDLVITAGQRTTRSIQLEIARAEGRWSPPPLPEDASVFHFPDLDDPGLWRLVKERNVDVAIQGGLGILNPSMLAVPRLGFVNVHPGKLPEYRGRNCPEWAILNGDDVFATAHLVDGGIDSGPVICAARYALQPGWDYADFRAHLYAHCAQVLVEALERLDGATAESLPRIATPQDESRARFWPALPPEELPRVKAALTKRTAA